MQKSVAFALRIRAPLVSQIDTPKTVDLAKSIIQATLAIVPCEQILHAPKTVNRTITFVVAKPSIGLMAIKNLQLSVRAIQFNVGIGFGEFYANTIGNGRKKIDCQAVMLAKNALARAGRVRRTNGIIDGIEDSDFYTATLTLLLSIRSHISENAWPIIQCYESNLNPKEISEKLNVYRQTVWRVISINHWDKADRLDLMFCRKLDRVFRDRLTAPDTKLRRDGNPKQFELDRGAPRGK